MNSKLILINPWKLKLEFMRLLTEDSSHHDRRRKDFNQAIFDAGEGFAVFTRTSLDMVMEKFNMAVKNLSARRFRCEKCGEEFTEKLTYHTRAQAGKNGEPIPIQCGPISKIKEVIE